MCEVSAAIALHSLKTFPATLDRRRRYAKRLRDSLEDSGGALTPQHVPSGVKSNFESLGVKCRTETGGIDEVVHMFEDNGIQARRYFWPALHSLPAWSGRFRLPVSDAVADSVVCLPLHGQMEERTLRRVEKAIRRVGKALREVGQK